jgi:O-antigen ligase
MARSLGATAAVTATLGIFGVRSVAEMRAPLRSALLAPARIILLVIALAVLASSFRPENLPSSKNFEKSTTVHRAVLATAGLELFAGSPIAGIGWQRSPLLIADPALNAQLRRTFGQNINPEFLPEKNPTGVHNAYVQILAESGLIGIFAFLLLLFAAGRGIRSTLRELRDDPRAYRAARCAVILLVMVMIWWNDNGLYGGQPETIVAAVSLGLVAASSTSTRAALPARAASR